MSTYSVNFPRSSHSVITCPTCAGTGLSCGGVCCLCNGVTTIRSYGTGYVSSSDGKSYTETFGSRFIFSTAGSADAAKVYWGPDAVRVPES